jgi:hypothetical protein
MKFLFVALLCLGGCATSSADTKANWNAIAQCAQINPANIAIQQAAISCIVSAVAGNEADCLKELAPIASWGLNELTCVAVITGANK